MDRVGATSARPAAARVAPVLAFGATYGGLQLLDGFGEREVGGQGALGAGNLGMAEDPAAQVGELFLQVPTLLAPVIRPLHVLVLPEGLVEQLLGSLHGSG